MHLTHQLTPTWFAIVALGSTTATATRETRRDEGLSSLAVSAPARGGEA
jgi:hypothetical protein